MLTVSGADKVMETIHEKGGIKMIKIAVRVYQQIQLYCMPTGSITITTDLMSLRQKKSRKCPTHRSDLNEGVDLEGWGQ